MRVCTGFGDLIITRSSRSKFGPQWFIFHSSHHNVVRVAQVDIIHKQQR